MSCKRPLLQRFIFRFFLVNTLIFWLIGIPYLRAIFSSATLFVTAAASFPSEAGQLLVSFFSVINYLYCLMLIAFIPAFILYLFTLVTSNLRVIAILCILFAIINALFLMIDVQVYNLFKFHLNQTLLSLALQSTWNTMFDFSWNELLAIYIISGLLVILECTIAYFVWKYIHINRGIVRASTTAIVWVGAAIFCNMALLISALQANNVLSQQIPILPYVGQVITHFLPAQGKSVLQKYTEHYFSQPIYSNAPLHYPLHPLQCSPPKQPYNIILIGSDALRFDSLTQQHMPHMAKWAEDQWQFKNHLSGGNSTQAGLFTFFYSIPPNYWTAVLKQQKHSALSTLLQKNDYTTNIFWSSQSRSPPFNKTIYLGVLKEHIKESAGHDVAESDQKTTDSVVSFLSTKPKQPFFLHLFYNSTHGYCGDESIPIVYTPIQSCARGLSMDMNQNEDPIPYYNRYLNSVRFVDHQIDTVLKSLKSLGYFDNSIIIFTSDHGEEFNDNHQNYWWHGSNFTDTQTHVPLVIHWPGEPARTIQYVTSSYDITPTLLQRLFNCQNLISDYSIGQNLLQAEGRLPFVLSGSYANVGLIEPDRLTTLYTTGVITVTDKGAKPMPEAKIHSKIVKQALSLMRVYF